MKTGIKFKEISAGSTHNIAIDIDGNVWTWGDNRCGQLGDGTNVSKNIPIKIETKVKLKQALAKGNFNIAMDYNGTIWSWGANYNGQLGDGTTTDRLVPTEM